MTLKKVDILLKSTIVLFLMFFGFATTSFADCTDVPVGKPDIFQVDTTKDTATLHITPVSGTVTGYSLVYGYDINDERFGATISGNSSGAMTYTLNSLNGGTKYAFRIQATNTCGSGTWSDWKTATTTGSSSPSKLPTTGPEKVLPLVFIVSGAIIFMSLVF